MQHNFVLVWGPVLGHQKWTQPNRTSANSGNYSASTLLISLFSDICSICFCPFSTSKACRLISTFSDLGESVFDLCVVSAVDHWRVSPSFRVSNRWFAKILFWTRDSILRRWKDSRCWISSRRKCIAVENFVASFQWRWSLLGWWWSTRVSSTTWRQKPKQTKICLYESRAWTPWYLRLGVEEHPPIPYCVPESSSRLSCGWISLWQMEGQRRVQLRQSNG